MRSPARHLRQHPGDCLMSHCRQQVYLCPASHGTGTGLRCARYFTRIHDRLLRTGLAQARPSSPNTPGPWGCRTRDLWPASIGPDRPSSFQFPTLAWLHRAPARMSGAADMHADSPENSR